MTRFARPRPRSALAYIGLALAVGCGSGSSGPALSPPPPPPPSPPPPPGSPPPAPPGNVFATVTLDTLTRFQVMEGWEAHAQSGNEFPGFPGWQGPLMDKAANDLGINRIRLELRAGMENSVDYHTLWRTGQITFEQDKAAWFAPINDNADPNVINPAGFQWSGLDWFMDGTVIPLRQRLLARGERLYLNLNYVAFRNGGGIHAGDPAEYAELLLAAFTHLRDKYGFVPDAVEVILEPDNGTLFTGTIIGRSIAAAGARLAAAGFRPDFIAPSVMDAANAVPYLNQAIAVPGAVQYLKTVSYHRYRNATPVTIAAIASRASQLGLRTAMLEHIGSGADDLFTDLTVGQVSAWQQFALAYGSADGGGGQYFSLPGGVPVLASRSIPLRQYFRYVRLGAWRVAASSDQTTVRPVGFTNVGGSPVVVLHVSRGGNIAIRGLRPGRYGVSFASTAAVDLPDAIAGADGTAYVTPAMSGVLTLYFKW